MARKSPMAGGFAIGLGATAGGLYGITQGQASAGLVIGAAIGAVVAVVVWVVDRRRGQVK